MSTTGRVHPVVNLSERVPPGPMREVMDTLQSAFGKVVSLTTIELLKDLAGYAITNAAGSPGTDIPEARTALHFADAGIDQLRLVVRGKNSGVGSVIVQVYRVTGSLTLAAVTVTDATLATFTGAWTTIKPTGADEDIGLRVVGDGAFDPILYRVDVQMRTLQRAT